MEPPRRAARFAILLLPVAALLAVLSLHQRHRNDHVIATALVGSWHGVAEEGAPGTLYVSFTEAGAGAITWNIPAPAATPSTPPTAWGGESQLIWQERGASTLFLRADPPYGHYGQQVPAPIQALSRGCEAEASLDPSGLTLTWPATGGPRYRFRLTRQSFTP